MGAGLARLGLVKLLLTDFDVRNASILAVLVDLLRRGQGPVHPDRRIRGLYGNPDGPCRFISGRSGDPMTELGRKSVGALELSALPSIDKERWVSRVREADALLVNGGDPLYRCHWMRQSGLGRPLPVAARHGLCPAQRREHGAEPPDRV